MELRLCMRIAFLVTTFPDLSETFILNQITGLIDRGHEVDIFAYRPAGDPRVHPDVNKYDLLRRTYYRAVPKCKMWRLLKAIWLIAKNVYKNPSPILQSLNFLKFGKSALNLTLLYATIPFVSGRSYDIIHCHFGPNGNLAIQLKSIGAIRGKIITTFHGYDLTLKKYNKNTFYHNLFEKSDLILAICMERKRRLIRLGCDPDKIRVHKTGINLSKFTSSREPNNGKVRITTVCRLAEVKGVCYGIYAINKLVQRLINIEYIIIGDGPLRKDVSEKIGDFNLTPYVKLLGWCNQDEIEQILRSTDIFLLPSITSKREEQEGIPTALIEALACEIPVVSTNYGGIPELVQDGISGFLVPERDFDAIAERLEYLILHPDVRQRMGKSGRGTVLKNHDMEKLNDRLVQIFHELMEYEPLRALQDN